MNLETLRVTHWTLPVKKAQVRAVHLSDLHLDDRTSIEWLQFLMRRIAAEQPDLILFSGDFTATRAPYRNPQRFSIYLRRWMPPWASLPCAATTTAGVQPEKAADLMKQAGFCVLENEAVELKTPSGEPVIVGGLAPMEKKEYDVRGVLWMKSRPEALRFLLIHEPVLAEKVPAGTADVLLAGHHASGAVPCAACGALMAAEIHGALCTRRISCASNAALCVGGALEKAALRCAGTPRASSL